MKSNVVFRPTVVIGLGGTGYGAVLKLKKHFRDAYGSVPQIIRFLTFDTTENVEHSERARDGLPVTLEPRTEQHVIQVANPAGLLGINEPIDSWWPKSIPINAIVAGAGQVRARGRLALFARSEEIIANIRDAISEVDLIKSRKQMYKEEFLVSERGGVEVYIVASLAGGTGSGMFLDVAFIARSFLDSTSNITGVLVLPGIFAGKAGVHLVKPNAFGALKELEQFSTLGQNGYRFSIEYGAHHPVEAQQPPFDLTYLVDSANELGRGIRETSELQSIIAQAMYLQIGSQIGTSEANTVDNIKTQLSTAGRVRNRSASYCSFGVGTLALPVRQFEAMEIDAARRLLNDGLLSGEFTEEELDAEVQRFVRDNKLREEDSDEVIDALAEQEKGGRMRFPMALGSITRFDGSAQALIKQLHATHRSRMEQQVAQRLEENYKQLLDRALKAVDDWWEAAINRPNGSTYAARFARKFVSKLEKYQQMMEDEGREQTALLESVSFRTAEEQIKDAAGAMLGRTGKVKNACDNYRGLVNRQCDLYLEKARREKAADLYGALRARVEELQQRGEVVRQKMKGALAALEQQFAEATTTRGGESPFEHTLKFDAERHRPAVTPEEFVQWHRENYGSFRAWAVVREEDIADEVKSFIKERYRPLTGLTIDEVLRAGDPAQVGRELNQLNHLSVPLWHYNDAKIPLNKRNIITELYHYGVADADDTALRDPKIASRVPRGTTELSFVSTHDPQRVMLFKVRVGIPLFALHGIEEMERAYNDPDKNVSNHVHKEWESFPSPIPRTGDGDAMRWFALAQAPAPVGLISRRGGWYYIRSKKAKKTEKGEMRLEQGRVNSYEKFEKDRDLVKEVEDNVESVLRSEGEAKVGALLRAHVEQLIVDVSSVDNSSIKEQVEREIEEIEKYLKQMATIS
ncbi:MAG TPA: tubulin-like doman-containing protein [Pyrinomonadaceae bacterium]|nr:tubulin-like doman-containing protein [Pyrinomonadaceae bacterium]